MFLTVCNEVNGEEAVAFLGVSFLLLSMIIGMIPTGECKFKNDTLGECVIL